MTRSVLWICDPQPRLFNALPNQKQLTANIIELINVCHNRYDVSDILITEQVPAKLGHTDEAIAEAANSSKLEKVVVAKTKLAGTEAIRKLEASKGVKFDRIVCAGAETHICVFKTVAQLLLASPDVEVVVVADCVASLSSQHHENALEVMRAWPRTRIEPLAGLPRKDTPTLKPHTMNLTNLMRHGPNVKLIVPPNGKQGKVDLAFKAWELFEPTREIIAEHKQKVEVHFTVPSEEPDKDALIVAITDAGCSSIGRYAEERNGVALVLEIFLFMLVNDAEDPNFKDTLQFVKAAKNL